MKKTVLILIVLVIAVSAFAVTNKKEVEVISSSGCYVFDVYDPKRVAGFNTNVFIGKVKNEIETVYPFEGMPHTVYSVEVYANS